MTEKQSRIGALIKGSLLLGVVLLISTMLTRFIAPQIAKSPLAPNTNQFAYRSPDPVDFDSCRPDSRSINTCYRSGGTSPVITWMNQRHYDDHGQPFNSNGSRSSAVHERGAGISLGDERRSAQGLDAILEMYTTGYYFQHKAELRENLLYPKLEYINGTLVPMKKRKKVARVSGREDR